MALAPPQAQTEDYRVNSRAAFFDQATKASFGFPGDTDWTARWAVASIPHSVRYDLARSDMADEDLRKFIRDYGVKAVYDQTQQQLKGAGLNPATGTQVVNRQGYRWQDVGNRNRDLYQTASMFGLVPQTYLDKWTRSLGHAFEYVTEAPSRGINHLLHMPVVADAGGTKFNMSPDSTVGDNLATELTYGRNVNSLPYKAIKGTVDFAVRTFTDPTVLLGEVVAARHAEARLIDDAATLTKFLDRPSFDRAATWMAKQDSPAVIQQAARNYGWGFTDHPDLYRALAAANTKEAVRATVIDGVLGRNFPRPLINGPLPAFYDGPGVRQFHNAIHEAESPRLFEIAPTGRYNLEDANVIEEFRRAAQVAAPSGPDRQNWINEKVDAFINGTVDARKQLPFEMWRDYGRRLGLSDQQIADLELKRGTYQYAKAKHAFGGEITGTDEIPQLESQFAYQFSGPSHSDYEALAHAARGGVKGSALNALSTANEAVFEAQSLPKGIWLAKPSTGIRISMDELAGMMGRFQIRPSRILGEWASSLADTFTRNPKAAAAEADKSIASLIEGADGLAGVGATVPPDFLASGEPLLHGTSRKFATFESGAQGRYASRTANKFYFTDNPRTAEQFANASGYQQVALDKYMNSGDFETEAEALTKMRSDLDRQISKGRKLVYTDAETGATVPVESASQVPDEDLTDGNVRLYAKDRAPNVIESQVYGKTLDLRNPDNIPADLAARLKKEGRFDPTEKFPNFGHEFSPELLKYARENGYGKIRVRDVAESNFESIIALPEYIGHGKTPEQVYAAVQRANPKAAPPMPIAEPIDPKTFDPQVPRSLLMQEHGSEWKNFAGPLPDEARALERELRSKGQKLDPNNWVYVEPDGPGHMRYWYQVANFQVRNDRVARILLEHFDNPAAGATAAEEWLGTGAGQKYMRQFPNAEIGGETRPLTASEVVANRQKMIDWQIPERLKPNAAVRNLTWDELNSVPVNERPSTMGYATKDAGKQGTIFRQWLNKAEDGMWWLNSQITDNLVRKPVNRILQQDEFARLHALATDAGTLAAGETSVEELARAAQDYAASQQIRMQHNPAERTRMDVALKSASPFSFAFTQFVKRWSRVMAENPAFVRKLQIFYGAGLNAGWFEKDEQGDVQFQIPIAPGLLSYVAQHGLGAPPNMFRNAFRFTLGRDENYGKLGNALFSPFKVFNKAAVPPMLPFSTHVLPGFGPVLTIPAALISLARPSLDEAPGAKEIRDMILGAGGGENEPGRGYLDTILGDVAPSWMSRFSQAMTGEHGDRVYANAQKDVLAWQAFNHRNPLDPKVQKQTSELTRGLYFVRGLLSFLSPYTPTPNVPGMQEADKLRRLQSKYGNEEGTRQYLDQAGQRGFLFTVPKSGRPEGVASLPPTKEAEQFYREHPDLFAKYRSVAGYLAPQGDTFDQPVYVRQLGEGFRTPLTWQEWLNKAVIVKGNDVYYGTIRKRYDAYLTEGYTATDLKPWLAAQQNSLDAQFPGWLAYHRAGATRAAERQSAITQLGQAVTDPSVAKMPAAQHIAAFLTAYNRALNTAQTAGYATLKSDDLTGVKSWLAGVYSNLYDKTHDDSLKTVYEHLFRGEVEGYGD